MEGQVITFLYYIRDVVGSNLGKDTDYPERFLELFSVLPGKFSGQCLKICHDDFLPHLSISLFAKAKTKRKKGKSIHVTGGVVPNIF